MKIIYLILILLLVSISPLCFINTLSIDQEIDNRIPLEYFKIKEYKNNINLFKF